MNLCDTNVILHYQWCTERGLLKFCQSWAEIRSLKVPKIKKILLYEMKFLVPNYSCLQNPWLGRYRPQIPVLSVLCPQLNLLLKPHPPEKNSWVEPPPHKKKFLGTPLYITVLRTPPMSATNISVALACWAQSDKGHKSFAPFLCFIQVSK
jgi:hypothetical protein